MEKKHCGGWVKMSQHVQKHGENGHDGFCPSKTKGSSTWFAFCLEMALFGSIFPQKTL
jgi:hypothetical protein